MTTDSPTPTGWLNRTVLGAGLTSFLADVCYEMASAALPGFLLALKLPAAAMVGILEGTADAIANLTKLAAGWYGDRLTRRKPLVVFGYALTGASQGLLALAWGFPVIFAAKTLGWLGKGIRGPLRNAILADAVAPADRGKAFGLHRAGDTLGAVVGPLLAFAALRAWPSGDVEPTATYRTIFWLTLFPGLASALSFALLIRERPRPANPRPFLQSLRSLPRGFYRLLAGVGIFGLGDCSASLLVIAATMTLTPALGQNRAVEFGMLMFAWRNLIQALASFPAGLLGDRLGPRGPLIAGYLLGAVTLLGFASTALFGVASRGVFVALFALAGIYVATEEALESVLTAELVPDRSLRGTAYGIMGTVNGVGDFFASLIVGLLLEYLGAATAFTTAAVFMLLGTITLAAFGRARVGNTDPST